MDKLKVSSVQVTCVDKLTSGETNQLTQVQYSHNCPSGKRVINYQSITSDILKSPLNINILNSGQILCSFAAGHVIPGGFVLIVGSYI